MNKISKNGFTVIEILVALFVFSMVGLVTTGLFSRALLIERKSAGIQSIQENALAVLELMAREIRVGVVEGQNNNCINTTLDIDVYDSSGNIVNIVYGLSNGLVTRVYGGTTYVISSNDVIFNRIIFCVSGSGLPSDKQAARVTILASITNSAGQATTVDLQTTVTSRDILGELQNP